MTDKAKIAVLGASGYTGSECARLLLCHPNVTIAALTADRRAGQEMRDVFPQFAPYKLPRLVPIEALDWAQEQFDLVFCALPHATTQKVVTDVLQRAPTTKVVDLSADFRLTPEAYARWYGHEHAAPELQKEAGEIPCRVPRVFPLVRHRNHVGVVEMSPLAVAAVLALVRRRGLVRIALEPVPDHIVIELLRPEQASERLPHHVACVGGEMARDHRIVEFVRFLAALREDALEVAAERRSHSLCSSSGDSRLPSRLRRR